MADETTTYQMTNARPENYWIAPDALYITLNAMGQPDYLQGNVSSGAVIMCYMRGIDGLSFDAGHNYRRWPLVVAPTYFNTSTPKYVYAAIPKSEAVNAYAQIVYPSEKIDLYGKNAKGEQIGVEGYYFIFLQGIISASVATDGTTQMRSWTQRVDCGSLASDEAIAAGGIDSWWQYSSVDDTVTFLKTIAKAFFDNITAKIATISKLILNGHEINGVATKDTPATSDDTLVTPKYIKDVGDSKYLRKDQNDSTKFTLGMNVANIDDRAKSTNFDNHAGFPFGTGWAAIKDDGSGASMLEVDKLFVRMKAYFAELEIRKISYLGGNYVFSSGGGKIYYVEWLDANGKILEQTEANKSLVYTFRCYLYTDDGTTQTMNWFKVDDQVRCQNFGDLSKPAKAANGVITVADYTTHYWWRRVNAVGNGVIAAKGDKKTYQYIDFQNTAGQYGADSDFPEIGDAMVQFGNWTTASRQGVIMIVVTGDDAPAIIEWQDVGANYKHFTMPENEYTRLSPRGDGNIIRGKFISVSGTTTDLTGKSIDEQIEALIDQINDIKNQADKKFDIWFNGGDPHPNSADDKTTNAPASDWTTDAEKGLHAQDLYYDTDKDPASNGGRAWRWMAHNVNSTVKYYWEEVTDKDTNDALDKARELQNQVNGKANVFVSKDIPSQPYKCGDMWIQTANGNNVMVCTVTRTGTGPGDLSDWADLSDTYDFKGIRTLLASLAEKIYDISGGYIKSRQKINVYLYKDGAEMKDGNIRFDGNGVARCSQNAWTKIDNAGYTDAFTCVYGVLGSSMLAAYSSKPSSASKYDLVIRKTSWHDSFKNEDVQGNIEILMYNGSSWEMLRESTKAIIENLGDEIRTVVFGSDNKGATDASGLVTRTMFSDLFSQKVKDDKVVTESTISTWLGENDYLTGASIKSWATDEAGFVKSATLDAYVKRVSNGDGTYSLESDIVLSADKINFIGKTIINKKFWVDKDGIVYMDDANVSGTINATKGKIGRFNIGYDGLYAGSWDSSKAETISDAWFDTDNKENICYLNSSSLWLEQQVGYFSAGDMAYMMVGLGRGSDPTTKGEENNYCSSAMYVYRNMMSMDFGGAESYYPAAKIISQNAFGCDIALRVVGGLQVHGGFMEKGYSMEYTASGNANVLDLSNGTTLLLYTSIAPKTEGHTKTYQSFFFPTLTKLRYQLGISDTATSFSVRVVIIARKDTQDYMICTQKGISGVTDAEAGILVDNNGNEWQSSHEIMRRGDVTIYSLTFTPTTGYYVQLISNAD